MCGCKKNQRCSIIIRTYIDCHVPTVRKKNCTESQSVRTGFENLMDGSYGAVATCSEEIMDSGHIFAVEV